MDVKWTKKWTGEEEVEEEKDEEEDGEEEGGRLFIRISLGWCKDNASPWPSCPEEPLPQVNILPSAVIAMLKVYKGL